MPSKIKSVCKNCGVNFTHGKSSYGIFCSNKCNGESKTKKVLEDWFNGTDKGYKVGFRIKPALRNYLLEKNNYSCSECGWNKINPKTGKSPLEIDHIDGDCSNNKEENLRVLCPNCHSLTPTWKALNKGNGNKESHRYSGLIK
jgi:hypothetical protein